MNLLREYIRELMESEYQRIQDESDQCTNATVLAIAHHFGDGYRQMLASDTLPVTTCTCT